MIALFLRCSSSLQGCFIIISNLCNIYKPIRAYITMASTPPGAKRQRLDYTIDKAIYDEFVKACSRKGYAPQVLIEQMMKKYTQTGQI